MYFLSFYDLILFALFQQILRFYWLFLVTYGIINDLKDDWFSCAHNVSKVYTGKPKIS